MKDFNKETWQETITKKIERLERKQATYTDFINEEIECMKRYVERGEGHELDVVACAKKIEQYANLLRVFAEVKSELKDTATIIENKINGKEL